MNLERFYKGLKVDRGLNNFNEVLGNIIPYNRKTIIRGYS